MFPTRMRKVGNIAFGHHKQNLLRHLTAFSCTLNGTSFKGDGLCFLMKTRFAIRDLRLNESERSHRNAQSDQDVQVER